MFGARRWAGFSFLPGRTDCDDRTGSVDGLGFVLVNPLARVWPTVGCGAVAGLARCYRCCPDWLRIGKSVGPGLAALVDVAGAGIGFVFADPSAGWLGGLGVGPIGFVLVNPLARVWTALVGTAVAGIGFVLALIAGLAGRSRRWRRLASDWRIRKSPALAATGTEGERRDAAFVLPQCPHNFAGEPALQFRRWRGGRQDLPVKGLVTG